MTIRQEYLDEAVMRVSGVTAAQQQDADPAHEHFYAWGGALDEITYRLAGACDILQRQIGAYGDNRVLRDDDGMVPATRLVRMQSFLDGLRAQFEQANVLARAYHSEASHVAVEVDPDAADPPA